MNYYNEYDPFAVNWLRNLIAAGLLPDGFVDERPIQEVRPDDLDGYTQCHFFAGIGGWSLALQLAGWPTDRPVWTGSCPCQPFSVAGKGKGAADDRHLWPDLFRLIRECRPPVIFGEQVANAVGASPTTHTDLQEVRDKSAVFGVLRELQRESSLDLQELYKRHRTSEEARPCAAGVGITKSMEGRKQRTCTCERSQAPREDEGIMLRTGPYGDSSPNRFRSVRIDWHSIRPDGSTRMERSVIGQDRFESGLYDGQCSRSTVCAECNGKQMGAEQNTGNCNSDKSQEDTSIRQSIFDAWVEVTEATGHAWLDGISSDLEGEGYACGAAVLGAHSVGAPHIRQRLFWVGNSIHARLERYRGLGKVQIPEKRQRKKRHVITTDSNNAWIQSTPVRYSGNRTRRIKPGVHLLADGVSGRVGRIRGYGNAIVPQVAAAFIRAYMDITGGDIERQSDRSNRR